MILGVGTDVVEIERVQRAVGREAFVSRVYTKAEQAYCQSRGAQACASYAARWAGKEAVLKAFGTGLRGGALTEVEILPDGLGCPHVQLAGAFAALAEQRGVRSIHISLSHAQAYATAVCVLEGDDEEAKA